MTMLNTNKAVSPMAGTYSPVPTRMPIADEPQIEAAVVSPRTLRPLFTMIPAPRKPMPVRTARAR
jgi:hypothetical protein